MHLVLVHHGAHYPLYIDDCVRQARRWNPDVPIHLVVDAPVFGIATERARAAGATAVVDSATVPPSAMHAQFERASTLDRGFRTGFWHFCSKRFLTLLDYARREGLTDVFHIEYDNLLFADLNPILQALRSHADFAHAAGVFDSELECVPSFMYFRDAAALEHLCGFMVQNTRHFGNEMFLLSAYRKAFPAHIGCLPVVPASHGRAAGLPDYLHQHADLFGCVFDGRAIGQYVGGVDPRNIPGNTVGFVNKDTSFRVDQLDVQHGVGACVPPTVCGGVPVVNLHVHSKDLQRWMTRTT